MSAEQDAGKSGKKLAALLGLSSIILFGGSYIAFSKLSGSNSDMQSAVNINSAASGGTRSVTETPHYRGKRAARTVLTGMCYSVGSATRQGSSSPTRFIGQSAMTSRT